MTHKIWDNQENRETILTYDGYCYRILGKDGVLYEYKKPRCTILAEIIKYNGVKI